MKKIFKIIAAIGGGMALVGILITVIALACGARFGALTLDSGVFGYIPFVQMRQGILHELTNELTSELSSELFGWSHWSDGIQNGSGNQYGNQYGQQNGQQNGRIEMDKVNRVKLNARGCTVQVVAGGPQHTGAVLELSGKLTQDHVRQHIDDEGELEIIIDTDRPLSGLDVSEYPAVLTLPPALAKLDVEAEGADVWLEGMSVTELEVDASMANVELSGVVAAQSDLNTDMGNISGSAQLSGKNNMECSMGNIELTVTGVVDYGYKIENSMGSVNIGGHEHNGTHNTVELNTAAVTVFDVENSMGNVIIDFS